MIHVDPNGIPVRDNRRGLPDGLFLCPHCRLWTPYEDGAHDAHGEACSPCWQALTDGEVPVPHPDHLDRSTRLPVAWMLLGELYALQRLTESSMVTP